MFSVDSSPSKDFSRSFSSSSFSSPPSSPSSPSSFGNSLSPRSPAAKGSSARFSLLPASSGQIPEVAAVHLSSISAATLSTTGSLDSKKKVSRLAPHLNGRFYPLPVGPTDMFVKPVNLSSQFSQAATSSAPPTVSKKKTSRLYPQSCSSPDMIDPFVKDLVLVSIDDHGSAIMYEKSVHKFGGKIKFHLSYIAKGCFHKVWKVKEKPGSVLKTVLNSNDNETIRRSIKETINAYDRLQVMVSQEGPISLKHYLRVVEMKNRANCTTDGYFEYELVEGKPAIFADVKEFIKKMIQNPLRLHIADFKPDNVFKPTTGGLPVIIDPSLEPTPLENADDWAMSLSKMFIQWFRYEGTKIVNHNAINQMIAEFSQLSFDAESLAIWNLTLGKINEQMSVAQPEIKS